MMYLKVTDAIAAELASLEAAATPGELHAAGGYLTVRNPMTGSFNSTIYHIDELGQKRLSPFQAVPFARAADAALIAAARNAIPALLADRTALIARVAELEGHVCLACDGAGTKDTEEDDPGEGPTCVTCGGLGVNTAARKGSGR